MSNLYQMLSLETGVPWKNKSIIAILKHQLPTSSNSLNLLFTLSHLTPGTGHAPCEHVQAGSGYSKCNFVKLQTISNLNICKKCKLTEGIEPLILWEDA